MLVTFNYKYSDPVILEEKRTIENSMQNRSTLGDTQSKIVSAAEVQVELKNPSLSTVQKSANKPVFNDDLLILLILLIVLKEPKRNAELIIVLLLLLLD